MTPREEAAHDHVRKARELTNAIDPLVPPFPLPARLIRWESDTCGKCPQPVVCLRHGWCGRAEQARILLERRAR